VLFSEEEGEEAERPKLEGAVVVGSNKKHAPKERLVMTHAQCSHVCPVGGIDGVQHLAAEYVVDIHSILLCLQQVGRHQKRADRYGVGIHLGHIIVVPASHVSGCTGGDQSTVAERQQLLHWLFCFGGGEPLSVFVQRSRGIVAERQHQGGCGR